MSENANNEKIKEYISGLESQIANYVSRNSDLLLKVEQLTKAGDTMANVIGFAMARNDGREPKIVQEWKAAKEGQPLS